MLEGWLQEAGAGAGAVHGFVRSFAVGFAAVGGRPRCRSQLLSWGVELVSDL